MDDPLDDVLRLVAAGDLSPEDAEPLIAALATGRPGEGRSSGQAASRGVPPPEASSPGPGAAPAGSPRGSGRAVRVQVTERGRTVVNLRIPISWTGLTSLVPGLSGAQVDQVSEALRSGERGRIIDIQDADGDGVVISTE